MQPEQPDDAPAGVDNVELQEAPEEARELAAPYSRQATAHHKHHHHRTKNAQAWDVSPHTWLRVDAAGNTRAITTGKYKLAVHLLNVQPRVSRGGAGGRLLGQCSACRGREEAHERMGHAAAWQRCALGCLLELLASCAVHSAAATHGPSWLRGAERCARPPRRARSQDLRLLDPRMAEAISPIAILVRDQCIVVNLTTLRWWAQLHCRVRPRAGVRRTCARSAQRTGRTCHPLHSPTAVRPRAAASSPRTTCSS